MSSAKLEKLIKLIKQNQILNLYFGNRIKTYIPFRKTLKFFLLLTGRDQWITPPSVNYISIFGRISEVTEITTNNQNNSSQTPNGPCCGHIPENVDINYKYKYKRAGGVRNVTKYFSPRIQKQQDGKWCLILDARKIHSSFPKDYFSDFTIKYDNQAQWSGEIITWTWDSCCTFDLNIIEQIENLCNCSDEPEVTLTNITIQDSDNRSQAQLNIGDSLSLSAFANYSDNHIDNITINPNTIWTSDNNSISIVSKINNDIILNAVSEGVTNIRATFNNKYDDFLVIVAGQKVSKIEVTPIAGYEGIYPNSKVAFKAVGYDENNNYMGDITQTSQWLSTDPNVAIIDSAGIVICVNEGTTEIKASKDNASGSFVITVNKKPNQPPTDDNPDISLNLVSITITSDFATTNIYHTLQLNAIGTYLDGSTKDITNFVKWNSDANTSVGTANICSYNDSNCNIPGLFVALSKGMVNVYATLNSINSQLLPINITQSELPTSIPSDVSIKSIEIIKSNPDTPNTLPTNSFLNFIVVALGSDNLQYDLTEKSIFVSESAFVKQPAGPPTSRISSTIGSYLKAGGLLTTIAPTASQYPDTIYATYYQQSPSLLLTSNRINIGITPRDLNSLKVSKLIDSTTRDYHDYDRSTYRFAQPTSIFNATFTDVSQLDRENINSECWSDSNNSQQEITTIHRHVDNGRFRFKSIKFTQVNNGSIATVNSAYALVIVKPTNTDRITLHDTYVVLTNNQSKTVQPRDYIVGNETYEIGDRLCLLYKNDLPYGGNTYKNLSIKVEVEFELIG